MKSESLTIAFEPRVIRVVKAKEREDNYVQRHEYSLLSLLIARYPKKAAELVAKEMLTNNAEKA
jgi:hypothetical protein